MEEVYGGHQCVAGIIPAGLQPLARIVDYLPFDPVTSNANRKAGMRLPG